MSADDDDVCVCVCVCGVPFLVPVLVNVMRLTSLLQNKYNWFLVLDHMIQSLITKKYRKTKYKLHEATLSIKTGGPTETHSRGKYSQHQIYTSRAGGTHTHKMAEH